MSEFLPQPEDILPLLPGALLALAILLVATRFAHSESMSHWAKIALLAIPAAIFVTWHQIYDEFPWPAKQSTERALWLLLLGPLASCLPRPLAMRPSVSGVLGFGIFAASFYFLLRPLIATESAFRIETPTVLLLIGGALLARSSLSELNRTSGAKLLPLALGLSLVSGSQILVFYGIASISQIMASCGLALLLFAPFSLFLKTTKPIEALILPLVLATGLFTSDAVFFGDDAPPFIALVALLLAPFVLFVDPVLVRTKIPIWLRRAILVFLLCSVAAWAIKTAFDARPKVADDPYSDYLEEGH